MNWAKADQENRERHILRPVCYKDGVPFYISMKFPMYHYYPEAQQYNMQLNKTGWDKHTPTCP